MITGTFICRIKNIDYGSMSAKDIYATVDAVCSEYLHEGKNVIEIQHLWNTVFIMCETLPTEKREALRWAVTKFAFNCIKVQ